MRIKVTVLLLFIISELFAQQDCPAIWGIAKMTFRISNLEIARDYYGKFLGFDEAFSYPSPLGEVISFKVNDRQFLEFIVDGNTRNKNRLVAVSLETENAEKMFYFLKSAGIDIPDGLITDGAENKTVTVTDLSGNNIEFIEFNPNGLHKQSKGKYLSPLRISKRIHHAGLYTKVLSDEDPFYSGILGFPQILRYPEDKEMKPVMIYFGIPECTESIEHYKTDDINFSHPCFLVDDMQETIYSLKERKTEWVSGKPAIGRGKRWILNLNNPDGTKVEFTEAYTVR